MAYKQSNPNGQATMANSEPVVIASDQSAVPVTVSGGATAANQSTMIGLIDGVEAAIDGIEGMVDGLEATTAAIQTAVELIDDPVKTLGTDTYTEATSKGVIVGAVRRDADTTLVDTTNEFTPLQVDANGRLKVEAFSGETLPVSDGAGSLTVDDGAGSLTVDNGGTFVTQENGAALTALQLIDDCIVTDDAAFTPATTKVAMVGFEYDDTTPDVVNEGDAGAARMSANRNQYIQIRDNAGNERGLNIDANGELGIGAIRSALPAGTNNIGDVDVLTLPALPAGTNNIGDVDILSIIPGTGATNLGKAEDAVHASGDVGVMALAVSNEANTARAADGDYLPIATDTEGNVRNVGNRDHDAVDAGEPLKVGGQARTTNPAAVADADRSNFITDKLGKQVTVGSIRDLKGEQQTTLTSTTTETTIIAAGGASVFRDVYALFLTNTSATGTEVEVRDVTAGGTIKYFYVPANSTIGFTLPESAALKQGTANSTWSAKCITSVASIKITALYVANL